MQIQTKTTLIVSGVINILLLVANVQAFAGEVVTSPVQDAEKTRALWGPNNKAGAAIMPLRSMAGKPQALNSEVKIGRPGSVPAILPMPERGKKNGPQQKQPTPDTSEVDPSFGLGSTVWYDYPSPYTTYVPVSGYTQFPQTALGKLFFSDGVFNYVCSAQAVSSEGNQDDPWGTGNRQTVVTAGHCCSDGAGSFYSNWVYEPAHVNGAAPFGSWTANSAAVLTAWHNGGDLSRDVCVLQMNTGPAPFTGQNLHDVTGALGYAYNKQLPQHYHSTGWPAEAPFNGSILWFAVASSAETDTNTAGELPFTHGIGSNLTGGSSGGAWILNYMPFPGWSNHQFNGLNSYKYTIPSRPAEMFGPFIDDQVINDLLKTVATQSPAP